MESVNTPSLRRATTIVLAGFAAAVLCLVFFAWLADEVLEGDTLRFDNQVRALVHAASGPALTDAMRIVTWIGSTVPVVVVTIFVVIVFWLHNKRRDAVCLAIIMTGAPLLDFVLKLSFHRARPTPFFGLATPDTYSFPSGHALVAFCFYGALAGLTSSDVRSLPLRTCIWAGAAFMALAIGLSRIYLGVHYPSDVIAGYAAAAVWVLAVMLAEPYFVRPPDHSELAG